MTDATDTTSPMNNASGVPHNSPMAKSRLNSSVPIIPKAFPPMIKLDSIISLFLSISYVSITNT